MLFSLYPTDAPEDRAAVVAQALTLAPTPTMFTSLHLPESSDLDGFGAILSGLHHDHGVEFCADVSPVTIKRLGGGLGGAAVLRSWGVRMLRIDFGFTPEEIRGIARASGCPIAVNASTVTASLLDELVDVRPVGWHNFYPRPETGLTASFYRSQNELFTDRGLPLYAFLPGETSLRAPLHRGLPTVEEHRHRTAWRTYLNLRRLGPDVEVVCAEGTLLPEHLDWIAEYERSGEVTLPVSGLDGAARFLADAAWRLRIEDAAASFRLEGTRGTTPPASARNADRRAAGSLQMDLDELGRYRGEVHLMRQDLPLTGLQAHIGEIAAPYRGMVDDLRPGDVVRLV